MTAIDVARGSAWMVVACYVLSLVLEIRRTRPQVAKAVWAIGALLLFAHILWTLLAVHHGSLHEAYDHTANQTERVIGVRIGAGLYVNFAMLLIWAGDATCWLTLANWSQIRQKLVLPLHAFFAFLFFNATVVFGTTPARWLGIVAIAIIVGAWLMKPRQAPKSDNAID
jgi:hypothetical protein